MLKRADFQVIARTKFGAIEMPDKMEFKRDIETFEHIVSAMSKEECNDPESLTPHRINEIASVTGLSAVSVRQSIGLLVDTVKEIARLDSTTEGE